MIDAHAHEGFTVLSLCVCLSTVYKLHIGFVLQIEHISRLYANLAKFSTYEVLSNAFFQQLQHFRLFFCQVSCFIAPYKLRILHYVRTVYEKR